MFRYNLLFALRKWLLDSLASLLYISAITDIEFSWKLKIDASG